ncbi:MAG: crotonobetainyl-CoA:carnitine CoA-transferase CaiB-like acyl-CoA transferase [Gammaproteobacteria bacterium]|jgi:crotonobetainyl-CoA:carnitine CoA-transferase CaiB-like acyl-CoA transferase
MIEGAFKGLKVVDLTQGLAGPFCAMTIAQHGAEVIKIEPPEGDWSRTMGGAFDDRTPAFVTCNRGKRAIVVNLKSEAGREVVFKLAATADVFMESNRAGVADRLGIGYAVIKALNPEIVYLSITGFGQQGPYRDRAVTDAIMQAFFGLMTRNKAADGLPRRIDFAVDDYTTGMMAYQTLQPPSMGVPWGKVGGIWTSI